MKKKVPYLLLVAVSFFIVSAVTAQPTVPAPTPPARSNAHVISIFSDAYTNVAGTNFNPWWGQSTVVTPIQIQQDNVLRFANLNYQGFQLQNPVNALTMNRLHVNVWTSDATTFRITPISPGPRERLVNCTPLVLNQWNTFVIDLTAFTGVNFSEIFQFKFEGNGTVFIDNLYFFDSNAAVDNVAPTQFSAVLGAVTSDGVQLLMTATDNSGAVNFEVSYGANVITAGAVSGTQRSLVIDNLLPSTAYSFSIVAKDASGNIASNSPIVLSAITLPPIPAAPAPIHAAHSVLSIFSDAFGSAAPSVNFFPGWGQSTVATIITLGGNNNTLKYSNLNYQGIEFGVDVNAATMTHLNIDVYTENETSLQITPISNAPVREFLIPLTPLNLFTWNRFNIPLSVFTGVDRNTLFQFKFVGSGGRTIYVDNLYFHNNVVLSVNQMKLAGLKVYPTVFTNQVKVDAESNIQDVVVRSITGQMVYMLSPNQKNATLDLPHLSQGTYILSVTLTDGRKATQKISKF